MRTCKEKERRTEKQKQEKGKVQPAVIRRKKCKYENRENCKEKKPVNTISQDKHV